MKTDVLHTRIAPSPKEQAETVFGQIGISSSDAIRIFFKQVVLRKGLPFDVVIPNKETAPTLKKRDRNVGGQDVCVPERCLCRVEKTGDRKIGDRGENGTG